MSFKHSIRQYIKKIYVNELLIIECKNPKEKHEIHEIYEVQVF